MHIHLKAMCYISTTQLLTLTLSNTHSLTCTKQFLNYLFPEINENENLCITERQPAQQCSEEF